MAFIPGQSGNPAGRPVKKPWTEALRLAAMREERDGKTALMKAAEKVVKKAKAGDAFAARELGDRLDGKSVQGVELSGPDGGAIEIEARSDLETARAVAFNLSLGTHALEKMAADKVAGREINPEDVLALQAAMKMAPLIQQVSLTVRAEHVADDVVESPGVELLRPVVETVAPKGTAPAAQPEQEFIGRDQYAGFRRPVVINGHRFRPDKY